MKYFVLAVGLALFAVAVWAVRRHFKSTGASPRFAVLAALTGVNVFVFGRDLWLFRKDPAWLWAALGLFLIATLLFAWTLKASRGAGLKLIYESDQPQSILQAGPYRYIRHPFYASYFPYWLGCAVATQNPINLAYALLLVPTLTMAARAEESGFDRSPCAADYARYRQRAGMFLPRLFGGRRTAS